MTDLKHLDNGLKLKFNIMELLNNELIKRFTVHGNQNLNEDPVVVAKYVEPETGDTYYATEYDHDIRCFYGLAVWNGKREWHLIELRELREWGAELDTSFQEQRLSNLCLINL